MADTPASPAAAAPAVAPVVASLSPATGPAGTKVAVLGSGFTGATAVKFGTASATSFVVDSDTSITAVAPAGTGSADVTVTTPGGTSAAVAGDRFLTVAPPVVTAITPAEGQAGGGTVVAITGTGLTGTTAVKFGAAPAEAFTVNNDTSINATSPPGAGTVDVVVTTPAGSSAATKFAYVGTPVVIANCTELPPVGNNGTVIPKTGVVLVTAPAKYGRKLHGFLSAVLPAGAAIDDVVEVYAVTSREHQDILVSMFPPVGKSINQHPVSTGINEDAASSVASNSGRIFRKVSATNWQSLGGGND